MPFKADTYCVLIASPSDLEEERLAATDAVNDWNSEHAAAESIVLLPVKWETHAMPQSGIRPQEAINRQLVQRCDFLIGMFWTKFGTSTGIADSGTVEEIDQFVAAQKPALLYFSHRLIDPAKIDIGQYERLKEFKDSTFKTALTGMFTSVEDLRHRLLRDLTRQVRQIKQHPRVPAVRGIPFRGIGSAISATPYTSTNWTDLSLQWPSLLRRATRILLRTKEFVEQQNVVFDRTQFATTIREFAIRREVAGRSDIQISVLDANRIYLYHDWENMVGTYASCTASDNVDMYDEIFGFNCGAVSWVDHTSNVLDGLPPMPTRLNIALFSVVERLDLRVVVEVHQEVFV